MSLDPLNDDLLLEPQVPLHLGSLHDLESFLNQVEVFHGVVGLFPQAERDMLSIEGETFLHTDTSSLVYVQDALAGGLVSAGNHHLWVVKESLGHITIEGGSTQIFFESTPTEPSTITLHQGTLELNFIPSLGTRPTVELIGQEDGLQTIYIAGEPTTLQVLVTPAAIQQGAQFSVSVLDELQIKLGAPSVEVSPDLSGEPSQDFLFDADSDLVWSDDILNMPVEPIAHTATANELFYDSVVIDTLNTEPEPLSAEAGVAEESVISVDGWVQEYLGASNTYDIGQFDEFESIVI